MKTIAFALLACVFAVQPVLAQQTTTPQAHTDATRPEPSREDLIKGLTLKKGVKRGLSIQAQAETGEGGGAVDLYVRFDYDSAQLSPESYVTLNTLAEAFAAPDLAKATFLIAGHTDSRGDDAYNLTLSEKRAQSVANYLIGAKGVDRARLTIMGKGEKELLDAANPESGVNRRVEIRNLGPKS